MPNYPKRIRVEHARRALKELGVNRPVYNVRVIGNRLELSLYGGEVVTWPPEAHAEEEAGHAT